MSEVERNFKMKGTVTKRVTVPLLLWEEWEKDCVESFNDTYYLKMMFDHEFRKTFQVTANLLMQEIVDMKEQLASVKAELVELKRVPAETPKAERKTYGANR